MLILHGVIFLGIFLALRKKGWKRKIGLLMLCGNLLGMIVTAAGLLSGEQPLTELERKAGKPGRSIWKRRTLRDGENRLPWRSRSCSIRLPRHRSCCRTSSGSWTA